MPIARVFFGSTVRVLAHNGRQLTLSPMEFGDVLLFDPKTTLAQAFEMMHMYDLR